MKANYTLFFSLFAYPIPPNPLPTVVVQRYELCYFFQRETSGYIYNEKIKLISNQLGSPYTYFGINSDGSAWFLICTSLISQQVWVAMAQLLLCESWMGGISLNPSLF